MELELEEEGEKDEEEEEEEERCCSIWEISSVHRPALDVGRYRGSRMYCTLLL